MAAAMHDMPQLMEAARRATELAEQKSAEMMQPVAGCHPLFSVDNVVARMQVPAGWKEGEPYPEYKGTSRSICALAMGDAIPGAPVSLHDVRVYRQCKCSRLPQNQHGRDGLRFFCRSCNTGWSCSIPPGASRWAFCRRRAMCR